MNVLKEVISITGDVIPRIYRRILECLFIYNNLKLKIRINTLKVKNEVCLQQKHNADHMKSSLMNDLYVTLY